MDFSWEQIWGGLVTTVLVGLSKVVFSFLREQKLKYEEEQKKKDQIISMLIENNKELMAWRKDIEKENNGLRDELRNINNKMERITDSDLILLKDRILQSCRYFINKGEISLGARENITEMYHCYERMGGNGTGKLIYEQTMKMKIKDLNVENLS
jgi:hypothetical protein